MIFLSINDSYSLLTVIGVAVIFFGLGFVYKMALIHKQRKRILTLEDEMLANHARILDLEKKVIETRNDKPATQLDFDLTAVKDREAKIS